MFTNDYAALLPDTPAARSIAAGCCARSASVASCRVVCFSPRHDLTLAHMDAAALGQVVAVWRAV
ncbi:MAG: hypothetical protein U0Z44_06210 [Kouleothrix sp.]